METQTEDTTTMEIKHSTWEDLNQRKKVGESFDDVIKRMILEFPVYKKLPKEESNKEMLKSIKKEINKI